MEQSKPAIITNNIPAEMKSLPIFQILGTEKIRNTVSVVKNNKTVAQLFFWSALIASTYLLVQILPSLLAYAQMTFWLITYSIFIIVLIMLYPKIVNLIYQAGSMLLFKGEKALVQNNPISTLQMLLIEAKETLSKVKNKITSVDSVKIEMITNSESSKKDAELKYSQVKKLTEKAKELSDEAESHKKSGNTELSNKFEREAKETRLSANLRMQEGKASEENARLYAQYANQFAKVLEVLKDNESAAKIYVSALDSSVNIIKKKMEATDKMKNATEGLAEVFNVKESWKFQEAMNSATSAISNNIASIRTNLEFLDQSKSMVAGIQPSQAELESFVREIDGGRLQTLNISEISDASYELKESDKLDKGFSLLD